MKARSYFNIFWTLLVISLLMLSSCKSAFPPAGTLVECNGQMLKPLENPTKKPSFPGGNQAMSQFFYENINIPNNLRIRGKKVLVAFIVTKSGEICDIRIISKPHKYIDDEVVRVVKMMPQWNPGTNNGENVDCYYLLKLKF